MRRCPDRTSAPRAAVAAPAGSCGRAPGFLAAAHFLPRFFEVPLAEGDCRGVRNFALPAPRIQAAVHHESRQMLDAGAGGLHRRPVELRTARTLPATFIASCLTNGKLVPLGDDLPPFVDLLVDVDLTGHTLVQLPLSVEAKGSELYLRRLNVGSMMTPIGPE